MAILLSLLKAPRKHLFTCLFTHSTPIQCGPLKRQKKLRWKCFSLICHTWSSFYDWDLAWQYMREKSNRQLRTGEWLKHESHSEIPRLMPALGREASESVLCPFYLGSLETMLKGSPKKSKAKLEGLEHHWEVYLEASVTKVWPAPWMFYYPSYTSIQSGPHVFRGGVILDFSFWQFHFLKKNGHTLFWNILRKVLLIICLHAC